MAFRFFKRIRLGKGLRLNLSPSGASLSVGVPGAWLTFGPYGPSVSVGIPGTGIYYRQYLKPRKSSRRRLRSHKKPGWLERLLLPEAEEKFLDALRALQEGNEEEALRYLQHVDHPDGWFLRSLLQLKRGRVEEAAEDILRVVPRMAELGQWFTRHGIQLQVELPITEELEAVVVPGPIAGYLLLIEILQAVGRYEEARQWAEKLYAQLPHDPVVRLSLIELLVDTADEAPWRRILELTEDIEEPETPVHTALLYYRGKALRHLGYPEAAYQVLTRALRRRKGRSPELLRHIRYERALALEALGQRARARREFERIYAEDTDFLDVAHRLGLKSVELS